MQRPWLNLQRYELILERAFLSHREQKVAARVRWRGRWAPSCRPSGPGWRASAQPTGPVVSTAVVGAG